MFEYFDKIAPENEEQLSETRVNNIKASVLSRIEEEKPMKKHFSIKPFVIAAAIMTTGAVSVLGASAATKNISDLTAPVTITYYQSDSAEFPENAEQYAGSYTFEALAEVGTVKFTETEISVENPEEEPIVYRKVLCKRVNDDGEEIFEIDNISFGIFAEGVSRLEEIIVEDDDGTRHFRNIQGGELSLVSDDADDGEIVTTSVYVRLTDSAVSLIAK